MNYRKFTKNAKAISPIFATLILIAIAVIAGVVVYMFTSGTLATMTAGGTAGTEKAAVQGVTLSVANGLTIYAQSTNFVNITINSAVVKNPNGDIVWATPSSWAGATLLSTGALTTMGPITGLTGVSQGNAYSVTIISSKGGSFVASGVVAGA